MTVPGNRFTLEGHDLVIVEVGHADTDDNTVLCVPDLGLVVAGDVIYNGAHLYLGESVPSADSGLAGRDRQSRGARAGTLWRPPEPQTRRRRRADDHRDRQYLDDADELLRTENSAVGFFNATIELYPDHLARTVLWAGASAIYGVRDHPEGTSARSSWRLAVTVDTLRVFFRGRRTLPKAAAFWILAGLFLMLFFASSAASPLYRCKARFRFRRPR